MVIEPSEVANIVYPYDSLFSGLYKKYIYFWKQPIVTQWSMTEPFVVRGIKFNCAEQWMMKCKADYFGDPETGAMILKASHPREQQALGRAVNNFIQKEWDSICDDVVLFGNLMKFSQNKEALKFLESTEGCLLVEASPKDRVWGIGISEEDAKAGKPWNGANKLGIALTKTREIIDSNIIKDFEIELFNKLERKNG
jgi:ribA/ribD-fused uncharacterized protein